MHGSVGLNGVHVVVVKFLKWLYSGSRVHIGVI